MKKTLAFILVLVLCCSASIGLTVAYLTDRDSAANIFTVGNVTIDLNENFEHGATLIPGKNIEKVPTITNTGNNAAWVWMTVAIPAALDNWNPASDQGSNNNVIHWNPMGATTAGKAAFAAGKEDYSYVTDTRVNNAKAAKLLDEDLTAEIITEKDMTWNVYNNFVNGGNAYQEKIGEIDYNVYILPYNKALQPGETTLPSLYQVALDARVDIDPEGDWHFVQDGNVTDLGWNSTKFGNPVIYVSAYAIQMDSFDNVKAGYDAYVAQWGKLNGYYDTKIPTIQNGVLNVEDDLTLLDNTLIREYKSTEPYTVNGNGNTVTMVASSVNTFDWTENYTIPLQSLIFSSENGALVTVNDLTITGVMQSVLAGNYEKTNQGIHNTVFNNVNIINPQVVSLSSNVSPALSVYGTMVMNNCNVYGATLSPLDTDPMWPVYDMIVVNHSNTTVNGGKIGTVFTWAKANLVFNGAEVDEITSACRKTSDFPNGGLTIGSGTTVNKITVTNANGVLTVKAGATVEVLDLTAVTNKTGITIEDGATVKQVIVDGEVVDFNTWKNS